MGESSNPITEKARAFRQQWQEDMATARRTLAPIRSTRLWTLLVVVLLVGFSLAVLTRIRYMPLGEASYLDTWTGQFCIRGACYDRVHRTR
jgi:hypothetical protein